jgi:hypothetical protein
MSVHGMHHACFSTTVTPVRGWRCKDVGRTEVERPLAGCYQSEGCSHPVDDAGSCVAAWHVPASTIVVEHVPSPHPAVGHDAGSWLLLSLFGHLPHCYILGNGLACAGTVRSRDMIEDIYEMCSSVTRAP